MKCFILSSFAFIVFSLGRTLHLGANDDLSKSNDAQQYETLFPIVHNGLYGFIDSTGKVRITPQFENYGDFSEGLAPVRKNGRYGYINTNGDFVIQPIYDYAEPFAGQAAIVMHEGIAKHIDREGKDLYKQQFASVSDYYKGVSVAKTKNGKVLIDKQGKYLSKEYDEISVLWNGYVLCANNVKAPGGGKKQYSILEENYNKVYEFTTATNGQSWLFEDCIVVKPDMYKDDMFVYYYRDKSVKRFKSELYFEEQENLDDALIAWEPVEVKGATVYNYYLLTTDGKIIAKHKSAYIESMGSGRYAIKVDKVAYMINGKAEKIGPNFSYLNNTFSHGRIVVKIDGAYQVMDTNGVLYHTINVPDVEQYGNYVFTKVEKGKQNYDEWKGLASLFDSLSIPSIYDNVNLKYADWGMYILYNGDQLKYANRSGEIVWSETKTDTNSPSYINVDYMMRTAYYAYGEDTENSIGGHSGSKNAPKIIDRDELKGGIKLVAIRSEEHKADSNMYLQNHTIFNLFVSNGGDTNLVFDAQDSRLYIVMQARNENGEWKDIEYSPSSWCGNSYHSMILPKGTYWKFDAPIYKGAIETKMRFKLDISSANQYKGQKQVTIYSNEFDGSVNPAQFWRRQGYTPSGLMDPYND